MTKNKHRNLILYLKRTLEWLEKDPSPDDNEIILLDMIRELENSGNRIYLALLRERIHHATLVIQNSKLGEWNNPFLTKKEYIEWAKLTQKLTKL